MAYIDDRFSIENLREEFIGRLKSLKREKNVVPELNFVDWDVPYPVFDRRLEEVWEEMDNPIRYDYMRRIYEVQGEKDDLVNISPVVGLKSLIPDYVETYSPENWEKEKEGFFSRSIKGPSDRVLCLFDMELKQGKKDGLNYLIETLGSEKYFAQTSCAVFSHWIAIGEEFENKKKWCATYSIPPGIAAKFYPVSKFSFYQQPIWGFIEGIKNVFIVEEVEKLKEQSLKIISAAHETVIKELNEITPETYNHIIQQTSKKEGIWEMNTLFRISNIIQDDALKRSISSQEKRERFNSLISTIRSFDDIYVGCEQLRWSRQAKELRYKEIFDAGEIINQLHYPLANGDIFQLGKKQYILLAQPCNISIRTHGNRGNGFSIVPMVEIVTEAPKNAHLYVKVESNDMYIKFSSNFFLHLDVLDLAVFNSEGICKLDMKRESPNNDLLHYPLQLRFRKLHGHYFNCKNKISDLESILIQTHKLPQFKSLLKPIITLDPGIKGFPDQPYNKENDEFNFEIRRVMRLKEPYSTDALQKFMLYLSRNGFDYDFTKSE